MPQIDRVSEDEVYLVDDKGRRVKRICGYRLPAGGVCRRTAGFGTIHLGVGLCKEHEAAAKQFPSVRDRNFWLDRLSLSNKESEIVEALTIASDIDEESLRDIDKVLRFYRGVVSVSHRACFEDFKAVSRRG